MPTTPITHESALPTNPSLTASAAQLVPESDAPGAPDLRTRVVLSSLWTAVMFVFAYVDIFAFFRADMIRGALAGVVPTVNFTIDQRFLVMTTLYVLVPSLMIAGSTMLPRRVLRPLTLVLAVLYAAGIVVAMIGDPWLYFQVGSAVEIVLLLVIARQAGRYRAGARTAASRPSA